MKRTVLGVLAVLAMVALSRPAMANTLTQGGVDYTYTTVDADTVQLVIDLSGATESGDLFSFTIDFGADVTVVGMTEDTPFDWSFPEQGSSNQSTGCNLQPNNNKWCTETDAPGIQFADDGSGGTYTFVFDITGDPDDAAHLQFFQGQGGLAISCDVGLDDNPNPEGECEGGTPVPEPGSLMLFGTGLLGMAGFLRRKLFA